MMAAARCPQGRSCAPGRKVLRDQTRGAVRGRQPLTVAASSTHFYTHSLCPYAHRVALTLKEKGVQHETTDIDLSRKPGWYYKINPNGLVPSLEVDGKVVIESLDICKFVDNTYDGPSLMPESGTEGFKVADGLISRCDRFVSSGLRYCAGTSRYWGIGPAGRDDKDSQAGFQLALDDLSAEIEKSGGPYFTGESVSVADLVYFPFMLRYDLVLRNLRDYDIRTAGSETGEVTPIGRWLITMEQREQVIDASPDYEKLERALLKHMSFDFFDYSTHFASTLP